MRAALAVVSAVCVSAKVLNVLDFGAVGDGHANDTLPIQRAIDEASSIGGATVFLPSRHSFRSGSLFLKSNVDFFIDAGSMLVGSKVGAYEACIATLADGLRSVSAAFFFFGVFVKYSQNYSDYAFIINPHGGRNRGSLINAARCANSTSDPSEIEAWFQGRGLAHAYGYTFQRGTKTRTLGATPFCTEYELVSNVTLRGAGAFGSPEERSTIDGSGEAWWFNNGKDNTRADAIAPIGIDGFTMRDLYITKSPEWTFDPLLCKNVLVQRNFVDAFSGRYAVMRDAFEYDGHNVDGLDMDSVENALYDSNVVHSGDDCSAFYSMAPQGRTRNVTVRNQTCLTPLTVTHGLDTAGVLFEDSVVDGGWGQEPLYVPRWWHTAHRIKMDPHTNGTLRDITYRNIEARSVDLVSEIQMYYACQNTSGLNSNYRACQEAWTPEPGVHPLIEDVSYEGIRVTGKPAFRSAWLECTPDRPCHSVRFDKETVSSLDEGAVNGFACNHAFASVSGTGSEQDGIPEQCRTGGLLPPCTDC